MSVTTSQVSFQANSAYKPKFDAYAKDRGISASALFNLFMRYVAEHEELPFTLDLKPIPANDPRITQFERNVTSRNYEPHDSTPEMKEFTRLGQEIESNA